MPAQIWLMENSWQYGFILRYPNGTTESTGIIYEPWHYRYVGKELAKELHESGLCLEDYLHQLSQ
jgi:D-alanyl-D-alanine carboxypeptidase